MGLLGDMFKGLKMKDPVEGTAQIVSATGYHGRGIMQNCRMQLVVQAEGVEPTAVEHSAVVHNRRWPRPGMTVPATVDRADPTNFKVDLGAIPDSRESAQDSAESIAAAMRGDGGGAGLGAGNAQVINLSGGDLSDLSDEQRQKLAALGIPVPGGEGGGGGGDDDLDKLQKLADLRDRGALTDEEFEDEKKKLLDD